MHTICTQYAHTEHRTQNTTIMQHTEDNREQDTETNTEQNTENNNTEQDNAQPQHRCAYDLHTYSYDLYHEQIYINNSNTIELYTILHD